MHFVTGATGLVGSYLCRYLLQQGKVVRALYRSSSAFHLLRDIEDKIEWVEGNVLDVHALDDAMAGVSKVYHCAALSSFFPQDRKALFAINIEGTANVVNMALENGVERLLHVSSVAAIGEKHGLLMDEKTKWESNKATPVYSLTKFLSEREIWRGQAEGLNTAIVNPATILAPNDWSKKANDKFFKVWQGLKVYPSGSVGWVDVRDVAWLITKIMESPVSGKRMILSSENLSFRHVLSKIATELGKPIPSIALSARILKPLSLIDAVVSSIIGKKPTVSREIANRSSLQLSYDNSDLYFGFDSTPIDQTIAETALVFRKAVAAGETSAILPLKSFAVGMHGKREEPQPVN